MAMKEAAEIIAGAFIDESKRLHLQELSSQLIESFPQKNPSEFTPYLSSLLCLLDASGPGRDFAAQVLSALVQKTELEIAKWVFGDTARVEICVGNLQNRTVAEALGTILSLKCTDDAVQQGRERIVTRMVTSLPCSQLKDLPSTVFLLSTFVDHCTVSESLQTFTTPDLLSKLLHALSTTSDAHIKAILEVLTAVFASQLFVDKIASLETHRNSLPKMCEDALLTLKGILERSATEMVAMQIGESYPRLGAVRLAAVQFLAALSALPFTSLALAISRSQALRLSTDLFFDYDWHSLLHHAFFKTVRSLLSASSSIPLLVISETGLPHHIVSTAFLAERGGKQIRPGHIGFITLISRLILKAANLSFFIHAELTKVDGWEEYVQQKLMPILDEEDRQPDVAITRKQSAELTITRIDELPSEDDDEDFELKEDECDQVHCVDRRTET